MKEYNILEESILSCLLIKPELIEKIKLEDKHFVHYQRLWQFMKSFYKKFKNFDIPLMCSVCKNKYQLMSYLIAISDIEPTTLNFENYQRQLLELFEESEKEKMIIEKIYALSNDLIVRNINLTQFENELKKIYKESDETFKGEK